MKTKLFFLLIILSVSHTLLQANSPKENKKIEINKENQSGPIRAPEQNPAQFNAILLLNKLIIYSENYYGNINVEIIGCGITLTQNCPIDEDEPAIIDISTLPDGIYSLTLYTSRGVFIGEFEL